MTVSLDYLNLKKQYILISWISFITIAGMLNLCFKVIPNNIDNLFIQIFSYIIGFFIIILMPFFLLIALSDKEDYDFIFFGKWNITRRIFKRLYCILEKRLLITIIITYPLLYCLIYLYNNIPKSLIIFIIILMFLMEPIHFITNKIFKIKLLGMRDWTIHDWNNDFVYYSNHITGVILWFGLLFLINNIELILTSVSSFFGVKHYTYLLTLIFSIFGILINYFHIILSNKVLYNKNNLKKYIEYNKTYDKKPIITYLVSNVNKSIFNIIIFIMLLITNSFLLLIINYTGIIMSYTTFMIFLAVITILFLCLILFSFLKGFISDISYLYGSRIFLTFKRILPWNLVQFLDYSTEHILLRKVGNSYQFIHDLFLEHFANLTNKDIERLAQEIDKQKTSTST